MLIDEFDVIAAGTDSHRAVNAGFGESEKSGLAQKYRSMYASNSVRTFENMAVDENRKTNVELFIRSGTRMCWPITM